MKHALVFAFLLLCGDVSAQIVECDTMGIGYVSSGIKFEEAIMTTPDSMITIPMINNTHANFAYPQVKLINTTPLPTGMSLYTNNWNVFASAWNVGDTAPAHVEYYVNTPVPDNYTVSFKLFVTNFAPLSIDSCVFANVVTINLKPTSATSVNAVKQEDFSFYPNPAKEWIELDVRTASVIEIYSTTGNIIRTMTTTKQATTVDISDLSPGVYYLRNKQSGTVQKLVKSR